MSDIRAMTDEELMNLAPPEDTDVVEDDSLENESTDLPDEEAEDTSSDEEFTELDPESEEEEQDEDEEEDQGFNEEEEEGESYDPADDKVKGQVSYEEALKFYHRVLSPFKANGKEIAPRSVDDIVKLMEMGANYTKKMQEISPYRKAILSLDRLGLLEENKLNYLIDLHNKKPEAIKKLLQDSEYDPMDMDYDDGAEQPEYVPSNNIISDAEARLDEVLDNVQSLPGGNETLEVVHKTWDAQSKKVLGESPELLEAIHTQRQNGIYDQIVQEVERMRVLGQIPAHVSFIQAYRSVGDELNAQGAFTGKVQKAPRPTTVTTGRTRATVNNDKRAKSASITRGKPQKGKGRIVDLTDTSDDDFLEAMSKLMR